MRKRTLRKPHLNYDILYDLYINHNLRREKVFEELIKLGYNTTLTIVYRDIKYYNIVKPRELQKERIRLTSQKLYGTDHPKQSKIVEDKRKETCLKKYGTTHPLKNLEIREKVAKTNLKKYGNTRYLGTEKGKEKAKDTLIQRYGVDNYFKSEKFKEDLKQYNLDTYGVEYSFQRKDVRKKGEETMLKKYGVKNAGKSKELLAKREQTMIKKYGVSNPAQSKEIQEKMKSTCLERYGVENIFLSPDLKYNIKKEFSKPNNDFAELLDKYNISYEREYIIRMKSYDFKIDNYLIEIDPYATHNSTWGCYGDYKPLDKHYHFNKSKLAEENGFICIHVFDWVDRNYIIDILLEKKEFKYTQNNEPNCYVYNSKSKNAFIKPDNYILNKYEVLIYDDGKIFHNQ